MIPAYAKMIMTAILSITAILLFVFLGGRSRRECMIAMLLSTIGDVFMVDGVINWEYSTFVGAAMFIAAHIVYAGCFVKNINERGYTYCNKGFNAGLWLMILSAVILGALPDTVLFPKPVLFRFCPRYVLYRILLSVRRLQRQPFPSRFL